MRWLVTGAAGQLGKAFEYLLPGRDNIFFADRKACNLAAKDSVMRCLSQTKPNVIINCSGYTNVDAAEDNEAAAMRVNADAVGELARWAADNEALMVHFSTDYVFDGRNTGAYTEAAPANPLSAYGRSKYEGESQFLESGANGFCLRTSWLHSNEGHNFFRTMQHLLQERDHLRVVDDQIGVPTTTGFLAQTTLKLIERNLISGLDLPSLIHVVPCGTTSWFGLASYIRDKLVEASGCGMRLAKIEPITSSEFPQMASRPMNSVMSNDLLRSSLAEPVERWEVWHDKLYGR